MPASGARASADGRVPRHAGVPGLVYEHRCAEPVLSVVGERGVPQLVRPYLRQWCAPGRDSPVPWPASIRGRTHTHWPMIRPQRFVVLHIRGAVADHRRSDRLYLPVPCRSILCIPPRVTA